MNEKINIEEIAHSIARRVAIRVDEILIERAPTKVLINAQKLIN